MKTLSEKPLAHTNDPETSFEAADRMVKSGKLQEQEEWILSHIAFYCNSNHTDNFTAKDVASFNKGTKHFYYIIQRRLSGLRNKGKIIRTGQKRDGCCVWRIK